MIIRKAIAMETLSSSIPLLTFLTEGSIAWLRLIMLGVCFFASFILLLKRRATEALFLLVVSSFLILAASLFAEALIKDLKDEHYVNPTGGFLETIAGTDTQEQATTVETTQPPAEAIPAAPVDWSFLPWFVGVAIVLVAVVAAFFVMAHYLPKMMSARDQRKQMEINQRNLRNDLIDRRNRAIASIESTVTERGRIELDPVWTFDYPEFTNMSSPVIIELSRKQKIAVSKADFIKNVPDDSLTTDDIKEVEHASSEFAAQLETAKEYAEQVKWGVLSREEKKLLKTAKQLLNMVSDESASENERHGALKSLANVVDKLRNDYGRMSFNVTKFYTAIESTSKMKMLTAV